MQILIYGGTQFVVRHRTGDWNIPAKVLEDKYGLPEKDWAFGAGVLAGGGFLILRRRQIGTANREYPYTVLLAPERETWERFGWNAAAMIISILSDENPVRTKLLEQPESITAADARALDEKIPTPQISPSSNLSETAALIAGSIFETESFAVNAATGRPYPSLSEIASILEGLPPLLRMGNGWLIGGSLSYAEPLGVRFVFNFQSQQTNDRLAHKVENKGFEVIGDWRAVENRPNLRGDLKKFARTPVWLWEKELRQNPPEFFKSLRRLSELLDKREISSDKEFLELKNNLATQSLLADELNQGFLKLICSTKRVLTPMQTEYLLEKFEGRELSAANLPANFLEHETYCDWLAKKGIFPSASEIALPLNSIEIFRVCDRLLETEKRPEAIPALFRRAVAEFTGENDFDSKHDLAHKAFRKTGKDWFQIWEEVRTEDFFVEFIKPFCTDAAREEVQKQAKDWPLRYLIYGDDSGGQWLSEFLPEKELKSLIGQLRHAIIQSYKLKDEATEWLQKLALSPVRDKLTITEKTEISLLNGDLAAGWQNFIILKNIFEGQISTGIKTASPAEIPFLRQELREYLPETAKFAEKAAPLKKLFGELPPEIAQKIEIEKAETEKAKRQTAETESKKKTESPQQTAADETGQLARLKQIAAQTDFIQKTQTEITETVFEILSDESSRRIVLKDFWQTKRSIWKDIFPVLPLDLRGELLLVLKAEDSTTTENLLSVFEESLKDGQQTAFQHALWETLLFSKAKKQLQRKILQRFGRGRGLAEKLEDLLKRPTGDGDWSLSPETADAEDGEMVYFAETRTGRVKNWFRRLFLKTKKIFGFEDSADD